MKTIATIVISLFLAQVASAQQAAAPAKNKTVNILPHRAFYSVKLESANKNSTVKDTDGRMIIELTHDCKGWNLKQDSASVIEMKSSPSESMRSVYTAQESDDGKSLSFKTERVFNEKTKDSVEGQAGFTDKGGSITYKTPETTQIQMKAGTMPPIAHMKKLIEAAESGQQSYSTQVFDGSFFGNPVLIDAFISDKKGNCQLTKTEETVYPMNLAIYAMPSTSSNPNFEITQNMGNNGVMCSYKINFGDYSVKGTLDRVEFLPNNVCKKQQ